MRNLLLLNQIVYLLVNMLLDDWLVLFFLVVKDLRVLEMLDQASNPL